MLTHVPEVADSPEFAAAADLFRSIVLDGYLEMATRWLEARLTALPLVAVLALHAGRAQMGVLAALVWLPKAHCPSSRCQSHQRTKTPRQPMPRKP